MGSFSSNMSINCLLQDGPTLTSSPTYLTYLSKHFEWNVKEIKKLNKYSHLAQRLDAIRLELVEICKQQNKANYLNFNDERTFVHGDLNATNILIYPVSLDVTAIIDWEFASFSFDDTSLDSIVSWFDNDDDDALKEKCLKEHNSLGKEVRSHFSKLNMEASQLAFHVSSWFHNDKQQDNYSSSNLVLKSYIDQQANLLVETIEKTPFYFEIMKKSFN